MTMRATLYRAGVLLLAALFRAATAAAQDTPADDAPRLGERIALQGAGAGVGACAACHGALGEGMASAGFPRLAGMPAFYLARQLHSYADGRRKHAVMSPIAQKLLPEQIDAIAAYYSAQHAPPDGAAAQQGPPGDLLARGKELAHVGDDALRVQACVNCHGPGGTGEPPRVPYLSGQAAAYIVASLDQWSDGARDTDPSRQMPHIAKRLSARDRQAVAAYFAARPPPGPAAARVNVPMGSTHRPVGPGEPSGAKPQSTQGRGVEQGGPTTGGNVGPGGGAGATGQGPPSGKEN